MNPNDQAAVIGLLVAAAVVGLVLLARTATKRRLEATKVMPGGMPDGSTAPQPDRPYQRERISRYDRLMADPNANTWNWELHQARLRKHGASQFKGTHYYLGPRGGVYYINSNGRRTYC